MSADTRRFYYKQFENSKVSVLVIEDDKHYSPASIAGNSIINAFRR